MGGGLYTGVCLLHVDVGVSEDVHNCYVWLQGAVNMYTTVMCGGRE